MSKLVSSLKNTKDRVGAKVYFKSHNLLFFIALLMIVILTIVIRLSPLLRGGQLIKAFDPWIQWYTSEYLDTHSLYEFFTWHDLKSWYPVGVSRYYLRPGLIFTVVFIHKIFLFFGLSISLYDICYFFPAFMGGVSVLVMYFLGKEVLDKKCGLLAAFFMAFSVGYMSRTTAGFFDNETVGVFAALMCLLYFIKALKSGRVTHAIIGGIFLGYLALSWGGYTYILLALPLIVGVLILTKKYNENVLIAYVGVQGMGLLIFSLYTAFDYGDLISNVEVGGVFLFTILLIIFHVFYAKKKDFPNFYRNLINFLKWAVIPAVLVFVVILWIAPQAIPLGLESRFVTVLSPLLREQMALVASVAEHVPSPWSSFYNNTLVPLMLVPLGIYFCFKRGNFKDIVLIICVLTLFYFTGSMTRIILIFAPIAALIAAYGLSRILNTYGSFIGERKSGISKKRRRQVKNSITNSEVVIVYLLVGVVCIAQVAHAVNASVDQLSYGSMTTGTQFHDWEESLTWMKNNLEGTSVVASWWDYGYWLTPIGNVTTVNDNGTANHTRIGEVGMAFMQTNELYAARILKDLKADYILVYFTYLIPNLGGDEGKWQWMLRIANDHYENYKTLGFEEDNWAEGAVFDEREYTTETGVKGTKWFESQLAKLMFWGVPTVDVDKYGNQLYTLYNQYINNYKTQDGKRWIEMIPEDGNYVSNVFIPEHFSTLGFVKLYKIDYTVLEASFTINDAEVLDSGSGTCRLENTGTKDLTIKNVSINGIDHDFALGKGANTNKIIAGDNDTMMITFDSDLFKIDDFVKISVTAEAEGIVRSYTFSESTSNFLVTEGIQDSIKINEVNSKVIQKNENQVDIYLEVENNGGVATFIGNIYANTEPNSLNSFPITYLSGSSIINPGEKVFIKISGVSSDVVDFYPLNEHSHKIGVSSANGFKDDILMSSTYEGYNITIFNNSLIISPEISLSTESSYRYHVPVELSNTRAYTYDNNTTEVYVKLKNTGISELLIDEVYITTISGEWKKISFAHYTLVSGSSILSIDQQDVLKITLDDYYKDLDIAVNDEVGIKIIASSSEESMVCSNVFYVHTINDTYDIQIIENVNSLDVNVGVSYILANETGTLMIKNTGNQAITLETIILDDSCSNSVTLDIDSNMIQFINGDANLDVQECAYMILNLTGLEINITNDIFVDVIANVSSADIYDYNFKALVNPPGGSVYYDIVINGPNTMKNSTHVNIMIENRGLLNVTVNSIYINNTFISLSEFSYSTLEIGVNDGIDDQITLSITLSTLGSILGEPVGNYVDIFIRTEEGPEAESLNEYIGNS